MKRFWFEFELTVNSPLMLKYGCGVTAWTYDDAINILKKTIFINEIPSVKLFIENVDIGNLDQDHVIPNMGAPNFRGVWFPIGY